MGIKIAIADDSDFADALQGFTDDFEQRRSEISGDTQVTRGLVSTSPSASRREEKRSIAMRQTRSTFNAS